MRDEEEQSKRLKEVDFGLRTRLRFKEIADHYNSCQARVDPRYRAVDNG
jgi:hypothetical protein